MKRRSSLISLLGYALFLAVGSAAPAGAERPNIVELSQSGEELSAEITQELSSNSALVSQSGVQSRATVSQRGGGEVLLSQTGAGHSARVIQESASIGTTFLELTQEGLDNSALVHQDGSDNSAQITQSGERNSAELLQLGSGNVMTQHQTGADLAIKIVQLGGANISVTQSGAGQ